MKLTLLNFICRLLFPNHWIKIHKYSRALDLWLLKQIEMDTFEGHDNFTCRLSGKEVWFQNYPYAYGHIHGLPEVCCGSYVAIKLKKYLDGKVYDS